MVSFVSPWLEDSGARIVSITHGPGDPADAEGGAGTDTVPFLRGTVMNSRGQGVVERRSLKFAAVTHSPLPPGIIHQHPSHGFGCRGVEVVATVPLPSLVPCPVFPIPN